MQMESLLRNRGPLGKGIGAPVAPVKEIADVHQCITELLLKLRRCTADHLTECSATIRQCP